MTSLYIYNQSRISLLINIKKSVEQKIYNSKTLLLVILENHNISVIMLRKLIDPQRSLRSYWYREAKKVYSNPTVLNFNVYPNPTTGDLQISDLMPNTQLQLFDAQGKLVGSWLCLAQKETLTLDVSEGVYYLEAQIESQLIRKKVVVLGN